MQPYGIFSQGGHERRHGVSGVACEDGSSAAGVRRHEGRQEQDPTGAKQDEGRGKEPLGQLCQPLN